MAIRKRKTGDVKGLTPEEAEVYKDAGANIDKSDVKGTPEYAAKQMNEKYAPLSNESTGFVPKDTSIQPTDKHVGDFIRTGGQNPDVMTDIENHDTAMDANDKAFEDIQSGKSTMGTEPIETPKMKEREELEQEKVKTQAAEELGKKSDEEVKSDLTEAAEEVDDPEVESKFKSIWQAWIDKDISKEDRNYLIIDALATFASNAGRNLRNIGAQFTGGSIDTTKDKGLWQQRNEAIAEAEREGAAEYVGGPKQRQRLREEINLKYQPQQLQQELDMMAKNLEAMGINVENGKDRRAAIEAIKQDPDWKSNPIKLYAVSAMSQGGVPTFSQVANGLLSGLGAAGKTFIGL